MKKLVLCFLLATIGSVGAFSKKSREGGRTTWLTDGTDSDVIAAISRAEGGDTVEIPAGSFTWTQQVTVNKPIVIQGAGAGGFVARSYTAHDVGAAQIGTSKVFTLDTEPYAFSGDGGRSEPTFDIGEELWIGFSARANHTYFIAEVTAYSFPTLTVDITDSAAGYDSSTGVDTGGDTQDTNENNWFIARQPSTTVTCVTDLGTDQGLFEMYGVKGGPARLEGVKLKCTNGTTLDVLVEMLPYSGIPPVVKDCWIAAWDGMVGMYWKENGGLVTGTSHDSGYIAENVNADKRAAATFKMKFGTHTHSSWATVSTMGMDDTTGYNNSYVENHFCWRTGITTTDWDDNSRIVIRYGVHESSDYGGHGMGTSPAGARHGEWYRNIFMWREDGSGWRSINSDSCIGNRGGTGLAWGNRWQEVDPTNRYNPSQTNPVNFTLWKLSQRDEGQYAGWGSNAYPIHSSNTDPDPPTFTGGDSTYPSPEWPCPRQAGTGYIDGSNVGYRGEPLGELEPFYCWGNTDVGWTNPNGANHVGLYSNNPPTYDGDSWCFYEFGSHDGGDGVANLSDSTSTWSTDALVGHYVFRDNTPIAGDTSRDGRGTISANTGTTVTSDITGVWNNGDRYYLVYVDFGSAYLKLDTDADGIVEGTHITNEAKPGWTPYTYPHPLTYKQPRDVYDGALVTTGGGVAAVALDGTGTAQVVFD